MRRVLPWAGLAIVLIGAAALLYDVFAEYDPTNLLLAQAVREVLERRLEAPRLTAAPRAGLGRPGPRRCHSPP